jgi:hypothetical protein
MLCCPSGLPTQPSLSLFLLAWLPLPYPQRNQSMLIYATIFKDTKNHENKGQRKGLSLTSKQGTRQDYVIQK